jgi:glycosyltransferase involved in cell wall biosynthesis
VGGMEKFASDFHENYRKQGEIELLANTGGKKNIPLFVVRVIFFLMFRSRNYDVIHIYDAVLSPLAFIVKIFSKAKVSYTVNGLDIVYTSFGYQKFMPFFLKKADRIFAISEYTMEQCTLRGIPADKITVIPVGINFDNFPAATQAQKSEIFSKFKIPTQGVKILLTVGRLVKRKGHAWFIANVLKKLPEDYIYVIAGAGPEQATIENLVRESNLSNRVSLLGRVTDDEKNCLYQISDVFIMPNIVVQNDQEGFGIVLLEAGRYGLPIIASDIEGIRDAVINQKTGRLIAEKDAQAFTDAILQPELDRSTLADAVAAHFDWKHIIQTYRKAFERM